MIKFLKVACLFLAGVCIGEITGCLSFSVSKLNSNSIPYHKNSMNTVIMINDISSDGDKVFFMNGGTYDVGIVVLISDNIPDVVKFSVGYLRSCPCRYFNLNTNADGQFCKYLVICRCGLLNEN